MRGLAAGEKLTVTYQGKRVSPKGARADSRGAYTGTFDVYIYWGTKTVVATGKFPGRTATRTFQVVRRHQPTRLRLTTVRVPAPRAS